MSGDIRRKPRGELRTALFGAPGVEQVSLPGSKEEIENHVLSEALDEVRSKGTDPWALTADPQRDSQFDFRLQTQQGVEHLDLMEIAPLQPDGGSYSSLPSDYTIGEFAARVLGTLRRKKLMKYAPSCGRVHVLLYTTDWKFGLPGGVRALLSLWLARESRVPGTVSYFGPMGSSGLGFHLLFPRAGAELDGIDEEALASRHIFLFDLAERRVVGEARGESTIRIAGPPVLETPAFTPTSRDAT